MLQILGLIISAVWQLLCIPFTVDNYTFNTWQVILFVVLIAVVLNRLLPKKEVK